MSGGVATVGRLAVSVTGDVDGLKTSMAEAQSVVGAAAKDMATSVSTVGTETDKVSAAGKRMVAQLQEEVRTFGMSREEILIYKASLTGAGDEVQRLANQLTALKSAQASQAAATKAASDAIKEAGGHMEEFNFQTAGAKRELLVLAHELSQGNFKRFGGSLMVLGEQTGAAGMLFSAAGIAAIGMGAAIVGIGAAMVKGAEEQKAMNDALIMTGGYAGVTGDSLNAMAHAAVEAGGSIGEAKKAVTELAGIGKFTAAQIAMITDAAVVMEHGTGQSIEKTIEQFESLAVQTSGNTMRSTEAITKAALKLDDQYHFLTESIYEQIHALEKDGDQKAASALAIDTLAKVTKERGEEMVANLGYVARGWNAIKEAIGGVGDALGNLGKKSTPGIEVDKYVAQLKSFDEATKFRHTQQGTDPDKLTPREESERLAIIKNLTAAVTEKNNADATAIAKGNAALAQSEAMHAASRIEQDDKRLEKKGMTELQVAIQEYGQDLAKIAAVNPTSALLGQDAVNAHMAALMKAHAQALKGQDDSAQILQNQLTIEQAALDREKSIYDSRDKMLDLYHTKFGMSDADFYAGREATRAEYIASEAISFAKESALLKAAEARAENPQEVAATKGKYDQLLKAHEKFVDDMRNASGQDRAAALAADQKPMQDYMAALDKSGQAELKTLDEQITKEQERGKEIGLTKAQVEALHSAQQDAATADLQNQSDAITLLLLQQDLSDDVRKIYVDLLAQINAQIEARRTLASIMADDSVREADARAAEDAAKAWKHAANTIENDLTNAILDGGGRGWKKLVRDMEMAFAKMVLQPILEPISGGLATSLSPFMGNSTISAGAATGAIGLAQTASNMYGLVTGGMTLGGGLGSGFMGSLAGGLNGAGIGSGLTSSIGLSIGNSIAGVVGPSVASAISTGLGAVATALPWIGAAVAAVSIGKLAFGMGPKQTTSQGMSGTLSADSLTGSNYANWTEKGGWFRSNKSGTDTTAFSAQAIAQFTQGMQSLEASATGFASSLGVSADWIKTYSKTFDITLTGDATKDAQAVTDFFNGVGDELANKLIPNLAQFSKTGETASATLQRLAGDFASTNQIAQLIGKTGAEMFGSLGLDSATARERVIDLAGGVSVLSQQAQSYATNYLTDAQKLVPVQKALDAAMASLGLSCVQTREQFKAVVDSLDLTTEAGAKEFASLMALSDAFAQVHPQIDATAAAAQAAADAMQAMKDAASGLLGDVDSAFTVLQNVTKVTTDAISARITAEKALSDAIKSTLGSMTVASTDLTDRMAAEAQIKSALAIAKAGGPLPTADSLKDALSAVSKDDSSKFASQADYLKDLYSTRNDLAQLGDLADNSLSVDQKQLDSLNKMLDAAKKQIDILKGIDTTGLSIEQALAGFQSAMARANQNPVVAATSAINGAYQQYLGRSPDAQGLAWWQNAAANGAPVSQIVDGIAGSTEATLDKLYQSVLGRAPDAQGLAFWMQAYGPTMDASETADWMKAAQKDPGYKGLPSFDVGTNSVPFDMVAQIHKGERIIPAADNRDLFARLSKPSSNNDALLAEIKSLKQQHAEAMTKNSAENVAVVKQLQAQVDLLTRVIYGGDAIQTKAAS